MAWVQTLPASAARDAVATTGQPVVTPPSPKPAAEKSNPPLDRAKVFTRWDADANGSLSIEEYRAGLKNDAEYQQRFQRFDRNGDGTLSRDEFINPTAK